MQEASWAIKEKPVTITSFLSPRSAGTKHDFHSEGDYWWPDPANPGGPYIQHDGETNPDNFVAHRHALIRFSKIVGALASAYLITGDDKFVSLAFEHARAWFVDSATRMNPSLLFAQAIQGRATGRGIGVIDTIHLMEVAQGLLVMQNSRVVDQALLTSIKNWFSDYLAWLTSHPYGIAEMEAQNNHGTCWVMQVSAFAKFAGDTALQTFCANRFKKILLPNQMATDGSFPRELARTKPYGYSLFNLDAMATICQVLSHQEESLWQFETNDHKEVKRGIEFMFPFVADKSKWKFKHDVMYWNEWPIAQPFLLFGAIAFKNPDWFNKWRSLDHYPKNDEVIRNLPIRHPLLWL